MGCNMENEQIKILFADDQIPNEDDTGNLTDDDIKKMLKAKYPNWPEEIRNHFPIMRKAVMTLRDAGYDVKVAQTYKDAIDLVNKEHFDIAIIDMGWKTDLEVEYQKRYNAGWGICEDIDKTDNKLKCMPTKKIIYSERFKDDPTISIDAAEKGILPLYKIYGEVGHYALKATVKFIEQHLKNPQATIEKRKKEYWEEELEQYKKLSKYTQIFVALSIFLLFSGAIVAIFGNLRIGTLTSISSILTGTISALLFSRLDKKQKIVEKILQNI